VRLSRFARALTLLVAGILGASPAAADVIFDGSTRPDGLRVELPPLRGVLYDIQELHGSRPGGGVNLFHSFERFDVEAGRIAQFSGSPEIRNVIARVTGGSLSRIDGTLRSGIAGVNLFLLNRQGVVFGAGSQVDVTGAFFASSAPTLHMTSVDLRTDLASDRSFELAGPDDSVRGFGFRNDAAAGAIRLDGARLRFAPIDGAFGFVGSEVDLRGGFVSARSGDVGLAAVTGSGTVVVRDPAQRTSGLGLIEFEDVQSGGPIRIHDGALISTSGLEPDELTPPETGRLLDPGSGSIAIRAGDLFIEDAELRSFSEGPEPGGDIDIALFGSMRIERISDLSFVGIAAGREGGFIDELPGWAPAGEVRIRADSLDVLGGAEIQTANLLDSEGDGGQIDIEARRMRISGVGLFDSAIRSNTLSEGAAGKIAIRADELVMDDHGALVAESRASGRAGDIDLTLGSLRMSGDARIDSSIRSTGVGGNIAVSVAGDAILSGASSAEEFTGITTLGQPESSAQAGTIHVSARNVLLSDGAKISAQSFGTGDAGSVTVEAAQTISLERAEISTRSDQRDGGNLTLNAPERIALVDSKVSASVRSGTGGNVTIDPEFLILDGSLIEARAEDGTGGNIDITAEFLLASPDSSISADSQRGVDGTVVIRSPSSDATAGPAALSAAYRDPSLTLAERCAQSRSGSFVAAGFAAPAWTPDQPRFAIHPGTEAIEAVAARGALESALARIDAQQGGLDVAHLALRGRLRVQLGRDADGWADLDASLSRADQVGDAAQAARIRLDRALLRDEAGEREAALRELDAARAPELRAAVALERAALAMGGASDEAHSSWEAARLA
jgi:filamentous hemagglutinin family protein